MTVAFFSFRGSSFSWFIWLGYPSTLSLCVWGNCAAVHAVMHTSASLTINENASSDVPLDMEDSLNRIVPEVCAFTSIWTRKSFFEGESECTFWSSLFNFCFFSIFFCRDTTTDIWMRAWMICQVSSLNLELLIIHYFSISCKPQQALWKSAGHRNIPGIFSVSLV